MRTGFLSRVRLLRWRDDDQLRDYGVSCACSLFAFAIDAGNVARLSGIENRYVDVRRDFGFFVAGTDYAGIVAGIRLLGRALDAAVGFVQSLNFLIFRMFR